MTRSASRPCCGSRTATTRHDRPARLKHVAPVALGRVAASPTKRSVEPDSGVGPKRAWPPASRPAMLQLSRARRLVRQREGLLSVQIGFSCVVPRMSGQRALRACCSVLILVTLLVGDRADSMTGGATQNPEPAWAVRLDLDGIPNCTGTLIAARWVLTAGHCLLGTTAPRITVRMRGVSFRAAGVHVHPDYTSLRVRFPDIGLVELPFDAIAVLGAQTLPLGTANDLEYFRGKGVTVFGYGRDESGSMTSSIKKSPDHAWRLAPYCQVTRDQCFLRQDWARNTTAIKGGDSGGPWVGWRNGQWRILSVVSGYISTDVPSIQAGTSVADPGVSSWIASTMTQRVVVPLASTTMRPGAWVSVKLSNCPPPPDSAQPVRIFYALDNAPYNSGWSYSPDSYSPGFVRATIITSPAGTDALGTHMARFACSVDSSYPYDVYYTYPEVRISLLEGSRPTMGFNRSTVRPGDLLTFSSTPCGSSAPFRTASVWINWATGDAGGELYYDASSSVNIHPVTVTVPADIPVGARISGGVVCRAPFTDLWGRSNPWPPVVTVV